ncbi:MULTISPECIES: hypothetical protein [Bradyrhizobium]|jgi:hypothetical protein|uniref:hypothetical protein n=1 Tax=Bradyrhizobium TaxID=374 RepID=UPI0003A9E9A8|nr:hypothetical protein [Bradyrhizobium denitrificans]MCL8488816.1 hypothetical protein [Bradyrhizobium denitrificans]RTM04826.1 MAG: hypothetical protein EKK32_04815 [Bradyrhizobiaceae bacterium]
MSELIEPLARMAGIDGAVPERSIEWPFRVSLEGLRTDGSHHQPHRRLAAEPSGLGRHLSATVPIGRMLASAPSLGRFA